MPRFVLRMSLLLPLVAALSAAAQDAPTRNGDTWNGQHHEPNPGAVRSGEQQQGIAAPPQQQRQENDEVEQLNDDLQMRAKRDAQRPVPPAP